MKKLYIFIEILLILICTIIITKINIFLFIPTFILIICIIFLNSIIKQKNFEIEHLNYICETTREFKHDFNNIMQSMGGFIQTNNLEDLKQYYNSLIAECFHVNSLYRFHSKLMANTAIYSIIAYKYNIAEENKIKMDLDILTDLNNINFNTYQLCKILGIFLDNAIEATKECQNKFINLSFETINQNMIITVENTYYSKKIPIEKLFKKDFSTKPGNTGLGLWEVNKIIKKHKNVLLYTEANDNFFIQKLKIS